MQGLAWAVLDQLEQEQDALFMFICGRDWLFICGRDWLFICGRDWGWDLHFQTYRPMLCPSCKRLNVVHCPHIEKNRKVKPSQPTPCGRRNRQTMRDIMWEAVLEDQVDYAAVMAESRSERESRAAQRADSWSMPPPPSR